MLSGSDGDDPDTDPNEAQTHSTMVNLIEHPARIPNLPQEIIFDILSRLPAKTLVKFRCVSKPWLSLISEPHFVEKHLHLSTKDETFTNHRIILNRENNGTSFKTCSLYSIYNEPSLDAIELDYHFMNPLRNDCVVGSCNGLLCVTVGKEGSILLWNPTIKQIRVLPDSGIGRFVGDYHSQRFIYGFGYDKANDDYKVVVILSALARGYFESEVRVYSLRTNSWKRIQDFPNGCPDESQAAKFVSGDLIWPTVSLPDGTAANPILGMRWMIVSLDLARETFQDVPEPVCDIDYKRIMGVLRGCLCIMLSCGSHDDVWVMKEYGVGDSWTKLITIPHLEDSALPNCFPLFWPLNLSDDGEMLVEWNSRLVLYNSNDKAFKYPVINNFSTSVGSYVYIESLVSPNAEHW